MLYSQNLLSQPQCSRPNRAEEFLLRLMTLYCSPDKYSLGSPNLTRKSETLYICFKHLEGFSVLVFSKQALTSRARIASLAF